VHRRALDLPLIAAFAVAATIAALVDAPAAVRVVLNVPLVLVLPGYALIAALIPRRTARAELAALSLATSLGLAAVAGVVIAAFRVPLSATSWSLLLAAVTLIGVVVAAVRREPAAPAAPSLSLSTTSRRRSPSVLQIGLLGYAAIVAGAALIAAPRSVAELPDGGTTQLWLLPARAAAGASGSPGPADTASVDIGVANHEPTTNTYRLQLQLRGITVGEFPSIRLAPDETWYGTADAPPAGGGDLSAVLTRPDEPAFTRTVVLRGAPAATAPAAGVPGAPASPAASAPASAPTDPSGSPEAGG
jgi:uncharacterized membrane protein